MAANLTMNQESIRSYLASEMERLGFADEGRAFEYVCAQNVLKPYGLDDDETERGLVGGGHDGGFDGIYVFLNDMLVSGEEADSLSIRNKSRVDIHFIQAKNSTGLSETVFQKWDSSFGNLIRGGTSNEGRYSPDVIEAFELIRSILSRTLELKLVVKVAFWAVSVASEVHPNVIKALDDCRALVANHLPGNVDVEMNIIKDRDLFNLITRRPDSSKTLRGTKDPLCPDGSSAILTVRLGDFNDFITTPDGELDKVLFEANIRDYQGKTAVNKAIEETLENSGGIDFWWLNNGVTVVADAMTRGMDNDICLENPRIVNGLQTSNMINRYCQGCKGTEDDRKVLVKCIASNDQAVRAQVIAATNKQTAIPSAYLRALEPVQLRIERYFEEHGLHYDRRKSSCKNEGLKPQEILSVPFLGQCLIATLLQQPDYARARPAQILDDNAKYETIFSEGIPLDAYLSLGNLSLCVRQWLRESAYDKHTQNNIIFYVILAICAKEAGRFEVTAEDLVDVSVPSKVEIGQTAERVNAVFIKKGGTDKVAKSRDMVMAMKADLGF